MSAAGFMRGPGNEGAAWFDCGASFEWPEDTTEEDRATMLRLVEEHPSKCDECRLEELRGALWSLNLTETKAKLKALTRDAHEAGVPKVDIARAAGVSRPTVDKWLEEK